DLDQFKDVNDTFGHHIGDEVLRRVARLFLTRLRGTDVAARLGGDEFALLLPDTALEGGIRAAKQFLTTLRDEVWHFQGRDLRLGASVGVAAFPQHAGNVKDLLIAADLAMYTAKRNGGNQVAVCVDHEDAREQAASRLEWAQKLGAA